MGLQIITVTDQEMAQDTICPGDQLLVKRTWPNYRDGDVVVVRHKTKELIRKIEGGRVTLFPGMAISLEETALAGKVLRHFIAL